jgi:hypothetical protein
LSICRRSTDPVIPICSMSHTPPSTEKSIVNLRTATIKTSMQDLATRSVEARIYQVEAPI